jgi:hypothetical protein
VWCGDVLGDEESRLDIAVNGPVSTIKSSAAAIALVFILGIETCMMALAHNDESEPELCAWLIVLRCESCKGFLGGFHFEAEAFLKLANDDTQSQCDVDVELVVGIRTTRRFHRDRKGWRSANVLEHWQYWVGYQRLNPCFQ